MFGSDGAGPHTGRKAGLSILVVHTWISPAVPYWSAVEGGGVTAEILVGSALRAVV